MSAIYAKSVGSTDMPNNTLFGPTKIGLVHEKN